jgi:hypothetical protein
MTDESVVIRAEKIALTTQYYFEDVIYAFGWIFLVAGLPLLWILWYAGFAALVLGVIITSTCYKLVIDPADKAITEYLFFLGLKNASRTTTYNTLDHIFIKKGIYTQQLNLKSLSSTVRKERFDAYLIVDDRKYFLGDSNTILKIERKANNLAVRLGIKIVKNV